MSIFLDKSQRARDCRDELRSLRDQGSIFVATTHSVLVNMCIAELEDSRKALVSIDMKIVQGLSVGIGSFLLSYLLPLTTVAIAGFSFGFYHLAQRQAAKEQYDNALETLLNCCKWVGSSSGVSELTSSQCAQEMLKALRPLMTDQQFETFMNRAHLQTILDQTAVQAGTVAIEGHKLSKEEQGLYYNLYGYEQGHTLGVLFAITKLIPQAFATLSTYMPWNRPVQMPQVSAQDTLAAVATV